MQFDYANDDTTLFGMSNLATQTYGLQPTGDPPVGQWNPEVKLLNYPVDETWPFYCAVYESAVEESLTEADMNASNPVKAM